MGAANMPPSSCVVLASLFHFVVSINFPGLRIPSNRPLKSSYSIEPCIDVLQSGATRGNPVILNEGEGRRFLSPGYDGVSSYLPESKCLWTFAPAPGTSLRFTCSRFSVTPIDPVGEKCRGDFLRFYDLSLGNDLDESGERYCHSTGPDFSYNSEVQVLFRTNLDPVVSSGFDCQVVASTGQAIPPTQPASPASPAPTIPPPRVSSFAQQACVDVTVSGATSTTPVVLAAGEGRQFTSPGYDGVSNYAAEAKCLWTFAPAPGAELAFSCSAFSIISTAAVGERCAGDFLRFYDLATGNSLDDTGERYCHTSPPSFSYNSEIQVLFRSTPDSTVSTGFDCEVVATTATTTTTTTPGPQTSDCTTIDGPGAGKACMPFSYGSHRIAYDGCINRAPPGQYVAVVPSFDQAPSKSGSDDEDGEEFDFVEPIGNGFSPEFEFEGEEEFSNQFDAISFGPAPRRQSRPQVAPRHGEVDLDEMVFRSLFWCATEVDPSGYVMEWGQCNAGCKADPAGSYIPFSPRRSPASRVSQVNGLRFTHARRGDTVGQLAALIRVINKQKKGPN